MNKEAKQLLLVVYLLCFILVTLLSTSDVQMIVSQILVSILFGVGGTLVDRDIRNLKRKEKEQEMVNRIIRTSKNTRKSYN